jgi:hypothetical protein
MSCVRRECYLRHADVACAEHGARILCRKMMFRRELSELLGNPTGIVPSPRTDAIATLQTLTQAADDGSPLCQ